MGINFDGLNPEMKAKLEKVVDDKRITKQEFDSLTPEEQAALTSALGGVAPTDKTDVILKTVKKAQPKEAQKPQEEEKGFFGKAWDWVKDNAAGVAVGVGAVAAGAVAVATGLVTAPVALTVGAGLLLMGGLTSCSSDEPTPIGGMDVDIDNNIGVTINQNSSIADIIKYLDNMNLQLGNLANILAQIQKDTNLLNAGMEKIFMALVQMGVKIDDLYNMMDLKGDQIIKLLVQNNENQEEILNAISKGNDDIKAMLTQILNAVKAGNEIGVNNGKILNEILNALKNPDNSSNDTVIALLKQILDKITNLTVNGGDSDPKTQQLLMDILKAIQNMHGDMNVGFQAILDKMDKLSDGAKADLSAILDAIQKNTEKVEQGNQTAKENQAILQRILDMLGKIMPLLEGLGDKGDTIINLIKDITTGSTGGTVNIDLSKIEEMLAALLEQSKKNGNTLDEINSKLDIVAVSVEGVKLSLDKLTNLTAEFKAEVSAKLDAILDKIGSGKCDCNVSLEIIIQRLDTIIEKLKNDSNHEGILDDLDNLLG